MGCDDNGGTTNPMLTDNFDRGEMLTFWAEDIIIPAYETYTLELGGLHSSATLFFESPEPSSLELFRNAWLDAYLAWQGVSMFEIGKAEEIGLRNYTNIYPANIELIQSNIESGSYNLELPSNFTAQGFPALDYLLFGIAETEESIIDSLTSSQIQSYTTTLIDRMITLSSEVREDWNQNFRSTFIANDGSSATSSTDKMVNDFLFHYERFLRAAKIGLPAGIFSGSPEADLVEARYSGLYSKSLFVQAFTDVHDFFNGVSHNGTKQGPSLKQYLDEISIANDGSNDISSRILSQWESAENKVTELDDNFRDQILEDNTKMLATYDELQKAVVLLKVDMLQALNIQVDFVDADGD